MALNPHNNSWPTLTPDELKQLVSNQTSAVYTGPQFNPKPIRVEDMLVSAPKEIFDAKVRVLRADNGFIVSIIQGGSKHSTCVASTLDEVRNLIAAAMAEAQLER